MESADRNIQDNTVFKGKERSLSVWRAWIEIWRYSGGITFEWMSLSVWRAWIEILYSIKLTESGLVALRKESVDRNAGEPTQNVGKSLSLSTWRARVEDMSR